MRFSRPLIRCAAQVCAASIALFVIGGCGAEDSDADGVKSATKDAGSLVVYSGREKELVEPLYKKFEAQTGIDLDVRYADSPAMAAQMLEEGKRSPADVFYSQDAGAIGAVEDLLAELPESLISDVPARFRDADGRWTGVTGRARTLVYNTDEVKQADLPASVLDVTDGKWKGRIGVAPTNASFIAFVSAMRQQLGDAKTKSFLEELAANDPRIYEKNGAIVDAVAKGEVRAGLVNHYYLYEKLGDDPDLPIANHFFETGDIGGMVNTSAIGILASAANPKQAEQLVEFMLAEGQQFIVDEAPEREYPLTAGADIASNPRYKELPALDSIGSPDIDLSSLGGEIESTVKMIQDAGLGS